jgi:hypothetical protein
MLEVKGVDVGGKRSCCWRKKELMLEAKGVDVGGRS